MARGDPTFARCNTSFIFDPRCYAMPNGECRWLHHVLYMMCVQERSSILQPKYTPAFLAATCQIKVNQVHDFMADMTDIGLIGWTHDHEPVIFGVEAQHTAIRWLVPEPDADQLINPWTDDPNWKWTPVMASPKRSKGKGGSRKQKDLYNPDAFEKFWKAYPNKTGRGEAEKRWTELKPDDALIEKIIKAVETQKTWAQWTKDNGQFIPHPSTWLNNKRWEDQGPSAPPEPSQYHRTPGT